MAVPLWLAPVRQAAQVQVAEHLEPVPWVLVLVRALLVLLAVRELRVALQEVQVVPEQEQVILVQLVRVLSHQGEVLVVLPEAG
jgi:hypothetical protein